MYAVGKLIYDLAANVNEVLSKNYGRSIIVQISIVLENINEEQIKIMGGHSSNINRGK